VRTSRVAPHRVQAWNWRPAHNPYERDGSQILDTFDPDAVQQVGGTGTGLLLVEAGVLQEMAKRSGWLGWFKPDPEGVWIGHDTMFMRRLRDMGIPVHLDGRVCAGHVASMVVDESSGR
jgi:hypothetical protein